MKDKKFRLKTISILTNSMDNSSIFLMGFKIPWIVEILLIFPVFSRLPTFLNLWAIQLPRETNSNRNEQFCYFSVCIKLSFIAEFSGQFFFFLDPCILQLTFKIFIVWSLLNDWKNVLKTNSNFTPRNGENSTTIKYPR